MYNDWPRQGYGDRRNNSRGGRGRNFTNDDTKENNNNDDVVIPDNAEEELFIKGINYEANEDDLKETFNKYGAVSSCKILKDKETQKSRGIGFVKFEDKKSAVLALNDADNLVCKGRNLLVRFSNDKEGEFKGKKKGAGFNSHNNESNDFNNNENKRNEDGGDRGGRGRGRGGRGRGGERGGRGGDRGGRGRGGFRGNDRGGRGRGKGFGQDDSKNDDSEKGWGSFNNRERSRSNSKDKENEW